LIGGRDWSTTPLGPIERWPKSLASVLSICLGTSFPMAVQWGPDLIQLYNDAAIPVFGRKHPAALGRPARENFPEFWQFTPVEQMVQEIYRTGTPMHGEDARLAVDRRGFLEDAYFTFSLSPIVDDEGMVLGLLNTYVETTARVLGERRVATLRALAEHAAEPGTIEQACRNAMAALSTDPHDLRFVLLYVVEPDGNAASLEGTIAMEVGHEVSPSRVTLSRDDPRLVWPLARVLETGRAELVEDLPSKLDVASIVQRRVPPQDAFVLPVARLGEERATGVLVVGLAARLQFDQPYRGFLELVAGQVASGIASARAWSEARTRAERLAELDRAKSVFFGDVSHELRTPLTLILGPVQDLLRGLHGPLSPSQRDELEAARRNALRLAKLVDGLLDFARIEAGRMEVVREPVDLAALTRELSAGFRSAADHGGIRVNVDCPPLLRPAFVDREMWEKIVLNLVSNALKYTATGSVDIALRVEDGRATLTVRDTGIGIAPEDLEHVFDRFYRVRGVRARSAEGTGIGLALVHDLVQLHGGTIHVESVVGRGTTFTVELPIEWADRAVVARSPGSRTLEPFLEEARAWQRNVRNFQEEQVPAREPDRERPRVLIADDNADVRHYLTRLLRAEYVVENAENGKVALDAARADPPDLVLSDVVMPVLDGVALVQALRDDERTRTIPIILVSARAGEEAALEALDAGADDYLLKPFSAKELLARVRTHVDLSRARKEAAESEAKDALLAVVAHELRTPLTSLALNMQIAIRELERARSPMAARLALTRSALTRMERLVEDLVSMAAIQEGQLPISLARHDLTTICREAAEEQTLVARRPIALSLPNEAMTAYVDADRIHQVVSNLLSNALKYSPPDRPVRLSLARVGGEAILSVRDEGPGLAPEQATHIFERFHRVPGVRVQSGSRTGLGLGLFISHSIVAQHGGRIWLDSAVGRGSTFSVAFPLIDRPGVTSCSSVDSKPTHASESSAQVPRGSPPPGSSSGSATAGSRSSSESSASAASASPSRTRAARTSSAPARRRRRTATSGS